MRKYYVVARVAYPDGREAMVSTGFDVSGRITSSALKGMTDFFMTDDGFIVDGQHPKKAIITFFNELGKEVTDDKA